MDYLLLIPYKHKEMEKLEEKYIRRNKYENIRNLMADPSFLVLTLEKLTQENAELYYQNMILEAQLNQENRQTFGMQWSQRGHKICGFGKIQNFYQLGLWTIDKVRRSCSV